MVVVTQPNPMAVAKRRAAVVDNLDQARELATGSYRAYIVEDRDGKEVHVVAYNPQQACGVAAAEFGIKARLVDSARAVQVSREQLVDWAKGLSEEQRKALIRDITPRK